MTILLLRRTTTSLHLLPHRQQLPRQQHLSLPMSPLSPTVQHTLLLRHHLTVPFPKPPVRTPGDPPAMSIHSMVINFTELSNTANGFRRMGIAGLPIFDVFPWILAYHGTSDFTAHTLSHGKYCRLIPTRSIAESVFTTRLLQEVRDKRLDLDAIAEKHSMDIPNKTTQARAYHAPLIQLLIHQLETHAPAAAEGSALRALKATANDFERAQAKLQAHGLELTPRKDAGIRPSAPSARPHINLQILRMSFSHPTHRSKMMSLKHGPPLP